LAGIAAATSMWLTSAAREAMAEQVTRAEILAADERAAQIGSALDTVRNRLATGAALPAASRAVVDGDLAAVGPALQEASRGIGVVRMSITRGDEVLVTLPDGTLPEPEGEFSYAVADSSEARVVITAPVRDAAGLKVGAINQELALTRLVPQLVQPFENHDGATTLVTTDGQVLVTTAPTGNIRIQSPELLALIGSGRAGTVSYYSDVLGADRIAAVTPVPGYPWMVLVGADASAAGTPAWELSRRLQGGFALAVTAAVLVLAAAGLNVGRVRRRLQDARAVAEDEAHRDGLTGLLNRRALEETLVRLRRSEGRVGVVLLDVNRMKEINDTYGHAAGDQALRIAGAAVRSAVRPEELAFRYGGDEFVVIFEGIGDEQLGRIAERVAVAIESDPGAGMGALSVSIGHVTGPARDVDELLAVADRRMYLEKGRYLAAAVTAR